MTLDEVRVAIKGMEKMTHDSEAAHFIEDTLYLAVLAAIADGSMESPQEAAALAITTREIRFERRCG